MNSWLNTDLSSGPANPRNLPGIGFWLRSWRAIPFANLAVRREAKVVLLVELAECLNQGVPLDEALARSCQTEQERRGSDPAAAPAADTRYGAFEFLSGFLLLLQFFLGWTLYLFSAAQTADVERVARLMAASLLRRLREGRRFDEALAREAGFDQWEVGAVRVAVVMGTLPTVLGQIAECQRTRLRSAGSGSWAPVIVLLFVCPTLITFIWWKVLPKFADIFAQMGVELPAITGFLLGLSRGPLVIVPLGLVALSFIGLLRALMNGRRFSRWLFGLMATAAALPAIPALFGLAGKVPALVAAGACALVVPALVPLLTRWTEGLVHWCERQAEWVFAFVPVLRSAAQAERDARWIAVLRSGLAVGLPEAQAIRNAGDSSDAATGARSSACAARVEAGVALATALVDARVLGAASATRVALASRTHRFVDSLAEISRDGFERAAVTRRRAERVFGIATVCLFGSVVAVMTLALYMPLFELPRHVGH